MEVVFLSRALCRGREYSTFFWSYCNVIQVHMIWMCFCFIKKNLKKKIQKKSMLAAQKTNFNPKNHILFDFLT